MPIKSIMVVDNSDADHLITEILIRDYNPAIEIIKAYDGAEALEILKKSDEEPSLILLDINMPGMDGFTFLEHYKDIHTSTVVVMLSSSDQEKDKTKALAYEPVKQYMVKPISVLDLETLEKSYLD